MDWPPGRSHAESAPRRQAECETCGLLSVRLTPCLRHYAGPCYRAPFSVHSCGLRETGAGGLWGGFHLVFRGVPLYSKLRPKGFGQVGETVKNIPGWRARRRRRQAARLEELVVGVLVVDIGLALAD